MWTGLKIAHRGAKGYEPENTIQAFQKALDLGCHGIEIDIHLSSDDHVMVIHDERVDRTTNGSGFIREFSLESLKKMTIGNSAKIPTLVETLDFLDGRCLVNIELKIGNAAEQVVEIVEDKILSGWEPGNFLVSSFDWVALKKVHEINPQIPLGVLTETDLQLAIAFGKFIGAHSIHPHHHLLTNETVDEIRSSGFKSYVWTVNEREDIDRLKSLNVDAIISDFPDRI